ncbi:hypothetical protein [Bradyrhizobium sp.]|jgi:hypothetical protein|uniref:hypothetical protein n=1 Tax=Bradyrhizobium sp. TaxID=376 RepID=UPI003C298473
MLLERLRTAYLRPASQAVISNSMLSGQDPSPQQINTSPRPAKPPRKRSEAAGLPRKATAETMEQQAESISLAAERMRRYRKRQRAGIRCLAIELRVTDIDKLIRRGHLKEEMRNDDPAVIKAIYDFLDSE